MDADGGDDGLQIVTAFTGDADKNKLKNYDQKFSGDIKKSSASTTKEHSASPMGKLCAA
jgi:hypothetical protein